MLRFLCLCVVACLALGGLALAGEMTFERLHADPPINGPSVRGVKVGPDGARVVYQKAREDNKDILDLWQFDPSDGRHRRLLRAEDLTDGPQELTAEEKARLERERIRESGITHYEFSKSGKQLLVPLGGKLYIYDLADGKVTALEDGAARLDPELSPDAKRVAFVRDRNLFVRSLADGAVRQLTTDGGETIVNGLADFIAQEEMDRTRGFWWSPSGSHIAFIRYDESPVATIDRVAIGGDGATLVTQRYPLAGTDNVRVKVGIVSPDTGKTVWADLGKEQDIYVPRVDWDEAGERLFVQRQPREQDRLDLLAVDPETGKTRRLIRESQPTWVNINDDLKPLADGSFLWGSERSGFKHIYRYDAGGKKPRALTAGNWLVDEIACVDVDAGFVYFTGWRDDPRTKHLYRTDLDGSRATTPRQISKRDGWHGIAAADDCSLYVDTFSGIDQPSQLSLHDSGGKRLSWLLENRLEESHPYAPYLDTHATPLYGSIEAEDGSTLHYRMTRPHDLDPQRRYPVIVAVYGGPHAQLVRKNWGRLSDQVWADHGFIVFRLDNRGSGRRGHAFEDPIHRRLGDVEVRDQLDGIRFLKTLPYVDGSRIGVSGWSYGGFMTAIMLGKAGGDVAAGFVGAPVTDWKLYDTHYTERYLDHPDDNPEGYELSSVFPVIDGIESPLLLVHGMADDNVVFTNATKFMQALQQRNIPFDLMTYPGETHFIRNRSSRVHRDHTVLRFFQTHLGPAGE